MIPLAANLGEAAFAIARSFFTTDRDVAWPVASSVRHRTENFAGAENNCRDLPVTIGSNQNNQEVMTMMQGNWMGGWGTGYMGGGGGFWMILVVILVIVGIVAVIRKK
ncbi:MAG: hypothetical protein KJ958_08350 [Gammaproteobacteria bacterium]|nr:hypothetical protein [Gammaproteobacteria bacterium]MBU1979162.1 hypothetical protein [Gammaproteobacteria bacterium]